MNTLQSCAVALLLLAVPTGISATALAQTAQISTDRDSCINSNNTATPEPAIAACTRLLEALARGEISVPEGAAVHVARGNLHAARGDVERAIGDYDRAIMLDPNRALADYDRAIELDPTDADAHVGRGRAHYQKKDYAAAIADYDAALRLAPGDVEALAERGDAHERAGLYDRRRGLQ